MTAAQILPGLIIGVVVAAASAFVSHLLVQRREKDRWKREDAHKNYAELREACVQFLAVCDRTWTDVMLTGAHSEQDHRELRLRWIEMRLVAPEEVAWSATDLYYTVSGKSPALESAIPSAEYGARVESFLAAVRSELAKPPARLSRPENTLPEEADGKG